MDEQTIVDQQQARNLTLLVYILQAVGFLSVGIAWVVAIFINYIKQDAVRGSWCDSHFRWQMRTFWYAILWSVLTSPLYLLLYVPGLFAWSVIGLWVLYRIIRGWLNFNDGRAMYGQ